MLARLGFGLWSEGPEATAETCKPKTQLNNGRYVIAHAQAIATQTSTVDQTVASASDQGASASDRPCNMGIRYIDTMQMLPMAAIISDPDQQVAKRPMQQQSRKSGDIQASHTEDPRQL